MTTAAAGSPARHVRATTKRQGSLLRSIALLWPYLRHHRAHVGGGMAALLAAVVLRLLEPWPIKFVVDAVTSGSVDPDAMLLAFLSVMALAFMLFAAGRAAADYASTVAFALAGSRVAMALRAEVFDHVQRLSLRQHTRMRTGDLVQRIVGDIGRLQEVAVTAGLPLVGNVVTTISMVAIILWLDPLMASGVVLAAVAFLFMSRRRTHAITEAAHRTRRAEGDLAAHVAETLGALPVIQAFGLEDETGRTFGSANGAILGGGVRGTRLSSALERRTDIVAALATALVLALGGWRVASGAITAGELVVFLSYLKSALKPLRDMAKYTGRIAKAAAAGERVADLLEMQPEIEERPTARDSGRLAGRLEFRAVSLAYAEGFEVLRDVDLTIEPGEHVALIGPSGGGKSSIAALILRLVEPTSGSVHLDGVDARDLTLVSLRRQLAIVLQEPVLFATSIRENIRYGRMDASDEEVERAADLAHAGAFVRALPRGFESVVGERGATLSGGERQRIALARALLRDASIVVLDEAMSAVDPESLIEIRHAIRSLTTGRTTIVITHDRASVADCDRILWVEDRHVRDMHRPAHLIEHARS